MAALSRGAALWGLLNAGIACWATAALCRRVLPGMASPRLRSFVLLATLPPAAHCLYTGQTNLLVFALADLRGDRAAGRAWWLAALLLAAAAHVKVWPLAGALLLTACWPRRLWWRLPLALVAVAALPLLVKPPHVVLDQYVQWYQHVAGQSPNRHPGYRDAWTIWEALVGPVNPAVYTIVQLAAGAVALGLCIRQSFRLPSCRLAFFALAAWTTWQLAFGPGTERNTFGLIAPLTGWAVVAAIAQRRAAWFMAVSYLLTVAASIRGVEELNPWLKTLHPLGVLLFFAWFLWWNAATSSLSLRERVRVRVRQRFSMGLPNSSMHCTRLQLVFQRQREHMTPRLVSLPKPDKLSCFPPATPEPSRTHKYLMARKIPASRMAKRRPKPKLRGKKKDPLFVEGQRRDQCMSITRISSCSRS